MANGRSTRHGTDLRGDLRVRTEEAAGVHTVQQGTLAPAPTLEPQRSSPRVRDDGALIEALGGYLTGEYQAEIVARDARLAAVEETASEHREMRGIYRDMWQQAEMAVEAQRNDLQWAIEARDRVIVMLLATVYRANILGRDATVDTQTELCASYVDELIDAARTSNTRTALRRPEAIMDEVYQDIMREDLAGMDTEEDSSSGDSVIDLTADEDIDMEEL